MTKIQGFLPIAHPDATILILGSMPSDSSLQKQQYYGHKRNAFWPIMKSILTEDISDNLDYSLCKKLLIDNKIALWDVLQSCHREGSLDTAIKMNSIQVNDFFTFLETHQNLQKILFNGSKAEAIFKKHVVKSINDRFENIKYSKLPSTSPAHASLNLNQKIVIWRKEIVERTV